MSLDAWGSFAFHIPYETPERGNELAKIIEESDLDQIYTGVGWTAGVVTVDRKDDHFEIYSDNAENKPDTFDENLENFYEELTKASFKIRSSTIYYEIDGQHLRGDFDEHGKLVWFDLDALHRFPVKVLQAMEDYGDALLNKATKEEILNQLNTVLEMSTRMAVAQGQNESVVIQFFREKNKLIDMLNMSEQAEWPYAESSN